ncbi:hypothetical protein BH10BAC2_BH10BAC2_38690 [soil metagenome]
MVPDKIKQRKIRIKKAGHIIAGGVILLHAYERYEHGHSSYLFFLVAGLIFLSVALFHHQLEKGFPGLIYCSSLLKQYYPLLLLTNIFMLAKQACPLCIYLQAFCKL